MLQTIIPAIVPFVFIILLALGVFFAFVPMLPAVLYMLLVTLAYGAVDHFSSISMGNLGVLVSIYIISLFVDMFSGILGAKYGGASRKSIWYGFIGMIVGFIILPPFGGFLGLFVGVFICEYLNKKESGQAWKSATGSVIGTLMGMVINIFLSFLFLGLFIYFIFS